MYISKSELSALLAGTRKRIDSINNSLSSYGDSKIVCRVKGDRAYYSERNQHGEIGISKNKQRIHDLMLREFWNEQLKQLELNEKALKHVLKSYNDIYSDNIILTLADRYSNIPVNDILISSTSDWGKQPYIKNPYHEEDYQYSTTNNILVRSKSEREIANALEAVGLPYQNDVLIKCSNTIYYADFIVMRPNKTKVIWEHFGRENDTAYMAKNQQRIKDYMALGYRPWDNLIWTLDSDLKDGKTIRKIINRFLLCEIDKGFSR